MHSSLKLVEVNKRQTSAHLLLHDLQVHPLLQEVAHGEEVVASVHLEPAEPQLVLLPRHHRRVDRLQLHFRRHQLHADVTGVGQVHVWDDFWEAVSCSVVLAFGHWCCLLGSSVRGRGGGGGVGLRSCRLRARRAGALLTCGRTSKRKQVVHVWTWHLHVATCNITSVGFHLFGPS